MTHKQDRHNCSVMINLKLFLSDLTKWRVHIKGSHVPPNSGPWQPPAPMKERLGEEIRDELLNTSAAAEVVTTAELQDVLLDKHLIPAHSRDTKTKRKIYCFVSNVKKKGTQKLCKQMNTVTRGNPQNMKPVTLISGPQNIMFQVISPVGSGGYYGSPSNQLNITNSPCRIQNIQPTSMFTSQLQPGTNIVTLSQATDDNVHIIRNNNAVAHSSDITTGTNITDIEQRESQILLNTSVLLGNPSFGQ